MEKCSRCGAETLLISAGAPICVSCESERVADRDWILGALRTKLEAAKIRLRLANQHFDQTAIEQPSGLPQPDGTSKVMQVGREYRDSLRAVEVATHDLSEFLLKGTVPLDLSRRPERRDARESHSKTDLG